MHKNLLEAFYSQRTFCFARSYAYFSVVYKNDAMDYSANQAVIEIRVGRQMISHGIFG